MVPKRFGVGGGRRTVLPRLLLAWIALSAVGCATQISRQELAGEYLNLGNAYFGLQNYQKAAEYFARAADLDPELRAAGLNLARAYISENRFDDALAIIDELLDEDPENIRLIQTRAYALYRAGRLDEALAAYRSALSDDPFNPDVLYNVAVILRARGETEEALSRVLVALDVDDTDAEAHLLAGRVSFELGRFTEAIDHLEIYIEMQRDDLDAKRILADALRNEGFYSRALTAYDEILRENPRSADALFGKSAALLIGAEDVPAGLEALRSAVSAGFADSDRAESVLLVEENPAIEETRQILADRGILDVVEDAATSDPDESVE